MRSYDDMKGKIEKINPEWVDKILNMKEAIKPPMKSNEQTTTD